MRIERDCLEGLIFGTVGERRFTQDSPVLPDVWLRYGQQQDGPRAPEDLLFTPFRQASAGKLGTALIRRVRAVRARAPSRTGARGRARPKETPGFAYNQTTVVARLEFDELIRAALPLSKWWQDYARRGGPIPTNFDTPPVRKRLTEALARLRDSGAANGSPAGRGRQASAEPSAWDPTPEFLWLVRLVGSMAAARDSKDPGTAEERREAFGELSRNHALVARSFCRVVARPPAPTTDESAPLLFLVSANREARPAITQSVLAVKADAARRLFNVKCADITWAIVDSGIDATHPAFRRRPPEEDEDEGEGRSASAGDGDAGGDDDGATAPARSANRVRATYDFTIVRHLLNPDVDEAKAHIRHLEELKAEASGAQLRHLEHELKVWKELAADRRGVAMRAKRLRERLLEGHTIDWAEMEHVLKLEGEDYTPPGHDHGTHVAGILGADWRPKDPPDAAGRQTTERMKGVCPDIELMDFRVLDDQGYGDEFSVMAALQFIRYLNAKGDTPVIHGVNLSLAIPHDVANYACGRTPVCVEAERVVASGVMVVAAAGNAGYMQYQTPTGSEEGYRSISITDPGNSESVLTVGATHRYHPHTYGVSYFSSRGPTGDGRVKPDLVAPGEKITSTTPAGWDVKDGTSMAAPHASGAAALLMARHRELIGEPLKVKQVLMETATDLGRERYFQGSGMLDILRALQHV